MTDLLLTQINAIINQYGCVATELGPDAVNVVGDARAARPCVYVSFPADMDWDRIQTISTLITNRVRVSRVLMEIASVATREQRGYLIYLIACKKLRDSH